MSESPVARQPMEESTAATDELGGGERLADKSATVSDVTAETARSSGAEARVADAAPAFYTEGPMVPDEQPALPQASEGVVEHATRRPSPRVVHPATAEEDEVEEMERAEPRP